MTFLKPLHWKVLPPGSYRIVGKAIKERDGTFSIIARNLPGCASQGDTIRDAIENFKEAAVACLTSYLVSGDPIPWKDVKTVMNERHVYGITVFVKPEVVQQ